MNSPGPSLTAGAGGLTGGWFTIGARGGAAGGFPVVLGALNILVNSPGSSSRVEIFRAGATGGGDTTGGRAAGGLTFFAPAPSNICVKAPVVSISMGTGALGDFGEGGGAAGGICPAGVICDAAVSFPAG